LYYHPGLESYFARFIAEPPLLAAAGVGGNGDDSSFGCGDFFTFHAELAALGLALGRERHHVVSYERLSSDFDSEVRSLAIFLEVPLGDAKLAALRVRTALGADLGSAHTVETARAGKVGGHREHLSARHWAALDRRAAAAAAAQRAPAALTCLAA
jgi:hypothetical protein